MDSVMELNLDNETERKAAFEILWETMPHRKPATKGRKPAALSAYLEITGSGKVIEGINYQATVETLLDAAETYAWRKPEYICMVTTWLNQGRWEEEADDVPRMKAYKLRSEKLKDRVSTSQLREILLRARMLFKSETKYGSAEGKKNSLKAVENAETALNEALNTGE